MPSSRSQFNVRMSPETEELVARVLPAVARAVGVELSQAQFFALAVAALAEKHGVPTDPPPGRPGKKKA